MIDSLVPRPIANRRFRSWRHLETLRKENQIILKTRRTPLFLVLAVAMIATFAAAWSVACVRLVKESATLLATGLAVLGIGSIAHLVRRLLRKDTLIRFDPETRLIHIDDDSTLETAACRVRELHLNTCSTQKTFVFVVTPDDCQELFRVEETQPKVSPIEILCQAAEIDYRIKALTSNQDLRLEIESMRETANHC
jgi:hypothetical protein